MSTTVKIILDTRRMKAKAKKYPVKLQVTYQRKTRHYQTIFDLSKEEYEKLNSPRINSDLQFTRDKLKLIRQTCENYVYDMTAFVFAEFERGFVAHNKLFKQRKRVSENQEILPLNDFDYTPYHKNFSMLLEKASRPRTISTVYIAYVKMLLQEERIGTAYNYRESYTSIKKFGGDCLFTEITKSFLVRYEQWMLKNGKSKTTIGIRVRCLRAIFNEANEMGIIKKDSCYTFGKAQV